MNRPFASWDNRDCERIQGLLSDYTDGSLSARQTWEVERHLADCRECAAQAQQMKVLVGALRSVERHSTPDDFMRKLHAQLDALGPVPQAQRSFSARWRDEWLALRNVLSLRRVSLVGAGLAAVGLLVFFVVGRPTSTSSPNTTNTTNTAAHLQQALERHVATAAGDPLDDPTAERLAAPLSLDSEGNGSE